MKGVTRETKKIYLKTKKIIQNLPKTSAKGSSRGTAHETTMTPPAWALAAEYAVTGAYCNGCLKREIGNRTFHIAYVVGCSSSAHLHRKRKMQFFLIQTYNM